MQGTSTKLTAGAFAASLVLCLSYALFEATWGPLWSQPPADVIVAFTGIIMSVTGWLVPESAPVVLE